MGKEILAAALGSRRRSLTFCSPLPASWNLPGPENYALQYADGVQTYITESVSLFVF